MRTIAIANQKGGCGKTTTAINLAVALAQRGNRVVIVDLDPQACATQALHGEPDATRATVYHPLVNIQIPMSEVVVHTSVDGLDLVPSNVSLAGAEVELIGKSGRELRLAQAFKTMRDQYQICVIDCPPSLGVLTLNALVASTDVVVPIQVDSYALKCAQRLLETVLIIRQRFHRYCAGNLRILLTCVEDRTSLGRRIQREMRELFGDLVLKTRIHRTVTMAEALAAGQAALTYAPASAAAAEYVKLAEELIAEEGEPVEEEALMEMAAMAQSALGSRETELSRTPVALAPLPPQESPEKPPVVRRKAQSKPRTPRSRPATPETPPAQASKPAGRAKSPRRPREALSRRPAAEAPESVPPARPEAAKPIEARTQPPEIVTRPVEAETHETIQPKPAEPTMPVESREQPPEVVLPQPEPTKAEAVQPRPQEPAKHVKSHRVYAVPTVRSRRRGRKVMLSLLFLLILVAVAAGVLYKLGMMNKPPVANSVTVNGQEDTPLSIALAGTDRDQDRLTYRVVKGPTHGQLRGTPPELVYTPTPNYHGPDSLTFVVNDGKAGSEPGTVLIVLAAVNDAPVANAQSVKVDDDKSVAITLTGSDIDNDLLKFSIVDQPQHGALARDAQFVGDGKLVYTPRGRSAGPDSFSFLVNDGTVDSKPATVSVTTVHVNSPPVAKSGELTTPEDTPVAITLTATDDDKDSLSYTVSKGPENGTLEGTTPTLRYTPKPNFNGTDKLTYEVHDGLGATGTGTITIRVTPVNDAPLFESQPVTTNASPGRKYVYDANAADPDAGDVLTYSLVEKPEGMSIDPASGLIQWTPGEAQMGTHSVVVEVADGSATPASARQSFAVTVGPPMPEKTTLTVSGGYDQKTQKALPVNDVRVQASDDEACRTDSGYYTVYDFSNVSIPAGAKITSVVLYVNHYEEPQFPAGKLEWKVGAGWLGNASSWASMPPSVYEGQRNKGTLSWDIKGAVDTPEKINKLQLQIKNNSMSPQKATFLDRAYVVVLWQ